MNDVLKTRGSLILGFGPPFLPACRLMGKVASDKCHKWVFKEPSECEPNISNYWQSSFDAVRNVPPCIFVIIISCAPSALHLSLSAVSLPPLQPPIASMHATVE
jgi:hypothetical protein